MLSVINLRKSYSSKVVLDGLSFEVRKGEIAGLLGPNGAGKSTTMKIMTGIISADCGSVSLDGVDLLANGMSAKKSIGYLPENNPLYIDMYVREFLMFVAGIYGIRGKRAKERVDEVVEMTGLTNEYRKKIGALSKGYRQRVGLAQAVLHEPEVLILDEPTTGLDPNQILEIRQLIKDFGKNRSVLFSTHIMQEAAAICDRVMILKKGTKVADMQAEGTTAEELENMFQRLTV